MRRSNRFLGICVLAGLVMLAGVSAARADVIWGAPDLSLTAPAASPQSYTLTIASNSSDPVNGYNFLVTLVGTSGNTGTVSFGTAVQASSNYVLNGLAGVAGYFGTSTLTSIQGTDGANAVAGNDTILSLSPKNLVTIPITISANAVGTWHVVWDKSGFQTNTFDYQGNEPAGGYQYHDGTITINPDVVVPAPLAAFGGIALFGLMGLRSWRRRQA